MIPLPLHLGDFSSSRKGFRVMLMMLVDESLFLMSIPLIREMTVKLTLRRKALLVGLALPHPCKTKATQWDGA